MQIHFLRNATLIVEAGSRRILVDPMLGRKGILPPLAFFRHRPERNPTVPLPTNAKLGLEAVNAALITHCRRGHLDHLDPSGWRWLARRGVPTYCSHLDQAYLKRRSINTVPLRPRQPFEFLGGSITPHSTTHGDGVIGRLMGPGLGYSIELPGEPSLYISGDTVLTPTVRDVLADLKPSVALLAAGGARLDIGRPILMDMEEILEFVRLAPGEVIATHMEALNHCPTTRAQLREFVDQARLGDKVRIPEDGEILTL